MGYALCEDHLRIQLACSCERNSFTLHSKGGFHALQACEIALVIAQLPAVRQFLKSTFRNQFDHVRLLTDIVLRTANG